MHDIVDKDRIQTFIIKEISVALKIDIDKIDSETEFLNLGIDSLAGLNLMTKLENLLNIELDPIIFWDYPTIEKLSKHLASKEAGA
ncbi:acyl carrier protein [Fulvivirga lutimaris]|uniref:acyl carrier protein n=1 Tax=Fulvivirga lutimaris TaxID=1819566 RepID=UPI0012BBCA1A|nr:acyl carrier protein [Fulvivirga lutimaris]MTI38069.1 acyl carrier protein [Fulvivirga lutimaris]